MTNHENHMKKDNIKGWFTFIIHLRTMLKFEEKPWFPNGNEKKLRSFLNLSVFAFFYNFWRDRLALPYI